MEAERHFGAGSRFPGHPMADARLRLPLAILLVWMATAVSPVRAADASDSGAVLYVGAALGVGAAIEEKEVCAIAFNRRCSADSTNAFSWSMYGGVDTPGRRLGVEVGWSDLGTSRFTVLNPSSSTTPGEVQLRSIYAAMKFAHPIGGSFTPFSKIGFHLWDRKTTYADGSRQNETQNDTDLLFGLGLEYEVRENLSIRADWTRYLLNVHRQDTQPHDSSEYFGDDRDVYFIGTVYRF